jgi:hypothetical protein
LCQKILRDARLIPALLKIDEELAAEARKGGCPCGGVLHTGNYARKPRGGPGIAAVDGAQDLRLSFCCNREGCRRRRTPPSVRFLGRRVYLGAVVVLATAMFHGLTAGRVRRIRELFGVGERTLGRWRKWWRETFTGTTFWKSARALFSPPVDDATLPLSMLDRFGGQASLDGLIGTLRFLSPITTSWRPKEAGSTMGG